MVKAFDVKNVNPNPARFDQKKADSINASHIRALSHDDFTQRLIPYLQKSGVLTSPVTAEELSILGKAAPLIQERITVLGEAGGMLGFLFLDSSRIQIEEDARKGLPENAKAIAIAAINALTTLEDFSTENIQGILNKVLIDDQGEKPKNAFGPLRTAISGRRVSPPLFESMEILGKVQTLARLEWFARS
jgi:glutamyl-tRNA synthetase